MTTDVAAHCSWKWTSFTAGFAIGLIAGIPLVAIGLIVLAQILTAMIALP